MASRVFGCSSPFGATGLSSQGSMAMVAPPGVVMTHAAWPHQVAVVPPGAAFVAAGAVAAAAGGLAPAGAAGGGVAGLAAGAAGAGFSSAWAMSENVPTTNPTVHRTWGRFMDPPLGRALYITRPGSPGQA